MNSIFLHLPPGGIQGEFAKIGEIEHEKEVHIYIDQMPKDPIGDIRW